MVRQTLIKNVIKGEMADIWNLFTQEEKAEMLGHFEVRTFKKDSTIYKEGEDSKFLMCLIRGKVKLTKEGVGGRYQIISQSPQATHFLSPVWPKAARSLNVSLLQQQTTQRRLWQLQAWSPQQF